LTSEGWNFFDGDWSRKGKEKGGIAVFWWRGINVSLRGLSQYYIDVDVKEDDGIAWRFTGVYGEAQSQLKHRTWQQLKALHVDPVQPWLCVGDFNDILFSHEKEGGRQRSQQCMDRFRETLEHCHLRDLGMKGTLSRGETTTMLQKIIYRKGWTGL
jgi:hypothetical protein